MKKVLSIFVSFLLLFAAVQSAVAYETVIVSFPDKQSWHVVYYDMQGREAILQYVPKGETYGNWTRTVIFHSYKGANQTQTASAFLNRTTSQMEMKNASQLYSYTKYTDVDAIATRCVQKNEYVPTQCEIYRVANSYEGLISMHYINKDVKDFKNTFNLWHEIIKGVRLYYSYYRTDRVLNKATIFEL